MIRALLARRPSRWFCVLMTLGVLMLSSRTLALSMQVNRANQYIKAAWMPDSLFAPTGCPRPDAHAEGRLDLMAALPTGHQRSLLATGRLLWLDGRCEPASQAWQQALQMTPSDRMAQLLASAADYSREGPEQWHRYLLPEESFEYALTMGALFQRRADVQGAIQWLERALELRTTRKLVDQLAALYLQTGDLEQAADTWQYLARTSPPSSADHWWGQGKAQETIGLWREAASAYQHGIEVDPHSYDLWLQLGAVAEHFDRQLAETAYRNAIQTAPDTIWPYLGLGHVLLNTGRVKEAEDQYLKAASIDPASISPKYHLGYLFYLNGEFQKSSQYFEEALQIDSTHSPSTYYLALSRRALGDLQAATTLLAHAIELSDDKPWHWALELGDWYRIDGDLVKARASYEQALRWNPSSDEVKTRISELRIGETN